MQNILKGLRGTSIRGVFFRSMRKKYAKDPLTVVGSLILGGRYNPKGEFGALYLSDSSGTSWAEIKRKDSNARVEDYPIFSISIDLHKVLDLTDESVCEALKKRRGTDLIGENRTETQAMGKAVREAGFEGILAPAAVGGGKTLAVFMDHLAKNSSVVLSGIVS